MLSTLLSWTSLLSICAAAATPFSSRKPAAFFLAGDSTTAVQSSNGGGWGTGFLGTLTNGAIGQNFGHNGATTASFRAGGDWAKVIAAATAQVNNSYEVFVTIQFGHNDQKATSGVSIAQYTHNLDVFAKDVLAIKAHPILVTPLSRRNYDSSGKVIDSLGEQRNITLDVASDDNISAIDLNQASAKYLNAIGKTNSTQYDLVSGDATHLNKAGSVVFGTMVSELLCEDTEYGSYLKTYTKPQDDIVKALETGTFIMPAV